MWFRPFSAIGNEIAVFQGMQTLFVVRMARRGNNDCGDYQHVGERFIHGFMDGEVVNCGRGRG